MAGCRPGGSSTTPATYVTHEAPIDEGVVAPGPLGGLRRRVLHGYLNSAYGYDFDGAIAAGRRVVPLVPTVPARTDRWIRSLERTGTRPRLLDVGCANGAFMLQMRGMGWEVEGIDFDRRALEHARRAGLNARAGTIADVDPATACFDAITLGHVIEHLHDPRVALVHLRRLLRPGGMLWMATPNIESLGHRRYGRNWFGLDPPRHLVLFSHQALVWLLADVGFARVERRPPRTRRAPSLRPERGDRPRAQPDRAPAPAARGGSGQGPAGGAHLPPAPSGGGGAARGGVDVGLTPRCHPTG